VSVYAELVRLALEREEFPDGPIADLVSEALFCRSALDSSGDAAARIGRVVAYDITLVWLCERLQIEHDLTGDSAGPSARQSAEQKLAGHLPSLKAELSERLRGP
jgi:hypothetical protein